MYMDVYVYRKKRKVHIYVIIYNIHNEIVAVAYASFGVKVIDNIHTVIPLLRVSYLAVGFVEIMISKVHLSTYNTRKHI